MFGPDLGRGGRLWKSLLLVLALACFWSAASVAGEKRVALVVGNASYSTKPLRNPRHDARLIASTLAAVGFDVMTVMDASRSNLESAIKEFGRRAHAPGSVALFFYAGHGIQAGGVNYLLPINSDIQSASDLADQALPLEDVFEALAREAAGLNIIVLDTCRENPFKNKSDLYAVGRAGLAPVVAPAGTIIGYATAPGQIAVDGEGAHSPYTSALAQFMRVPGISIESVFRHARRSVISETGGRQVPWEHSSLVGSFIFVPAPPDAAGGAAALQASSSDAGLGDIEAWQAIRTSHDVADYRAYVARYPRGLFVELATHRIAKLEIAQVMTPWQSVATPAFDTVAEAGEADARYWEAMMLAKRGTGARQLQQAAIVFAQAAARGHVHAMFRLAYAYDRGLGVGRNLELAARWYKKAADLGHPIALSSLGTMYEHGEGVELDLAEAVRLYRVAADVSDPAGMANLAYLYSQGKGVARNRDTARVLYRRAVKAGHPRAMFNLALILLAEHDEASKKEGLQLLEWAAEKKYVPALGQLARIYDRGVGVDPDAQRAADYVLKYLRAAHKAGQSPDASEQRWTFATRRQIQKQLAQRGLYDGFAHGIMNEKTRRALAALAENY